MKQANPLSLFRLAIFKNIPLKVVNEWFQKETFAVRHYAAGELVLSQGEPYSELYILQEGESIAEIQSFQGRTLQVETLKAPEALAMAILFADTNNLPVQVRAKTECLFVIVAKAAILRLAAREPQFLDNLLTDAGNRVAQLAEKIRFVHMTNLRQKICVYLWEESLRCGSRDFKVPHRKEALAEIFGVTRPALSRVFMALAEQGLIRQSGSRIQLMKPEIIEKLAMTAG